MRTTLNLSSQVHERAKAAAKSRHLSFSKFVEGLLSEAIHGADFERDPYLCCDVVETGKAGAPPDLSTNHRKYRAEARQAGKKQA